MCSYDVGMDVNALWVRAPMDQGSGFKVLKKEFRASEAFTV